MTQSDWKRFAALLDFDHDGSVRIEECVSYRLCTTLHLSAQASVCHRFQYHQVTSAHSCASVLAACVYERAGGYRRDGPQRS